LNRFGDSPGVASDVAFVTTDAALCAYTAEMGDRAKDRAEMTAIRFIMASSVMNKV
jgi:Na+/melibiose symporter-like transporter